MNCPIRLGRGHGIRFRAFSLSCLLLLALAGQSRAAELPKTTPLGILVDRVVPMADLHELDGSPDSPLSGLPRWRQTLHELQRAAERDLGWQAPPRGRPDQYFMTDKNSALSTVSLGLIQARYERMAPDGSLRAGDVFALTSMQPTIHDGGSFAFVLPQATIFSNGSLPAMAYTLDAGDGIGPRPLIPGIPVPVSYTETGVHHITLQASLNDGRTLTARTPVTVKRLATPTPDATWIVNATVSHAGLAASGQAYVYLAPGHTAVTNPVVVVEGFDLDNTMDWPVLYDLLNQQNLLEDLRSQGIDAVVLDFDEATEPIQRNAYVLTELLAMVNANTPPGRTTALVGASMGGLVSRYALLWMEQQGVDHQVRTYLSFDSPHGGANIPLGMQHWLRFFESESTDAAYLLSRLDTPAARQMLLYHQGATSGNSAAPDAARAAWLADLASVGNWPISPRLAAIANGSGTAQSQGFQPGDQLIEYVYRSLLVDIDGNVWSVPDVGTAQTIFYGNMNLIWPLPDRDETVGVSGTLPWDGAPGGTRGSMAQMDATAAPYGDIIALHDDHCFIPTISALALTGVQPFHHVANDADLMTRTAFDQVYWPTTNQGHIEITVENKAWFLAEIQMGFSGASDLPATAPVAALLPAVPNPFNPRTEIAFDLPAPSRVSVAVYDVAGRLVERLLDNEAYPAGRSVAVWEGRNGAGQNQPSGVYFAQLTARGSLPGRPMVQRLVLVR